MFGTYVCEKSSLKCFFPINTLSNVSYSGYRNHVQNYTLQERESSDHVTDQITC